MSVIQVINIPLVAMIYNIIAREVGFRENYLFKFAFSVFLKAIRTFHL